MKKILMALALALVLTAVPVMAQNNDQGGSGSTADGGQTQPGSGDSSGDGSSQDGQGDENPAEENRPPDPA